METPEIELQRELNSGERLIWSGRPGLGIRFRLNDWLLIPYSILCCSFTIFWEFTVVKSGASIFFSILGIIFILLSLHLVFGRYLIDAHRRKQTFYGLTNERVIIVSTLFSRITESIQLRTLNELSLTEKRDESGTITFGPKPSMYKGRTVDWLNMEKYNAPGFDFIDRAKHVYELIRRTQTEAGK